MQSARSAVSVFVGHKVGRCLFRGLHLQHHLHLHLHLNIHIHICVSFYTHFFFFFLQIAEPVPSACSSASYFVALAKLTFNFLVAARSP